MSDHSCFISVIIPVYNAEKYISKCLSSILKQSFCDFEVVVIDDGSTDRSSAIVKDYAKKDHRIKYYYQKNGGPVKARIQGMKIASGQYFTFCDADDYYTTRTAFQILHDAMDLHYDLIEFDVQIKYHFYKRNKNSIQNETVTGEVFYSRDFPSLLCNNWNRSKLNNNVWNKLYTKKLIDQIPEELMQKRIFWGEDLILNLFLLEHCENVKFLAKSLYCYRDLSGQTNHWKKSAMYDLDTIKHYQLQFAERRDEDKDLIVRGLYAEIAAWFFLHLQQAVNNLSDEEMKQYIEEVLALPSFVKARDYFLYQNDERWEAVDLLRMADAQKYIDAAKNASQKKESFSKKIKTTIKKMI